MNFLRILLVLSLVLPGVPAWPCETGKGPATESATTSIGHATAHQAPDPASHVDVNGHSHHGHSPSMMADTVPAETADESVHDCCASQDSSSSCLATQGCGQGPGASLLPVAANAIALQALPDQVMVRFTTALLPSHSLPPFRPPSV